MVDDVFLFILKLLFSFYGSRCSSSKSNVAYFSQLTRFARKYSNVYDFNKDIAIVNYV